MTKQAKPVPKNDWEYGLCDCYRQPAFCCGSFCCPCVAFASVATRSKLSACCKSIPNPCQWILYSICFFIPFGANVLLAISRAFTAKRYGIRAYFPCSNLCINICCAPCSLCQIHNELQFQRKKAEERLDFVEKIDVVIVVEPVGPMEGLNTMTRKMLPAEKIV